MKTILFYIILLLSCSFAPFTATFSIPLGFIPAVSQAYVVGQVSFANASATFFPAQMRLSNGLMDTCAVNSAQDDLKTTWTMQPPPCCEADFNLTADPADSCCYLLDVNFPNPASCMFPTNFDQITLMTSGTGVIASAVGLNLFSATANSTLATFTASPPFITPIPQPVGRVCFANNTTAPFTTQVVISNSTLTPDSCAQSFSFPVATPCFGPCTSISVSDTSVCTTDETLLIPLLGCSNACGRIQVKWYVQSPCGTGPWTLYQVTPDCSPLLFLPNQYTNDICVYAEVLTDGTCDCPLLVSDTATVQLCAPVGCSIQNTNPDFCDTGTPVPITVVPSGGTPNCPLSLTWYDGQGIPVGNSLTYTPPSLVFQGLPEDCYQDYLYKAVFNGPCGKDSCFTTIRVYNSNAPKGKLEMFPVEAQPLCPGEDAILKYTEGCTGDPKMWKWYVRPCVPPPPTVPPTTYLSDAGTMNPLYYTNELYQSAWYYVETQNGVCPLDTVQLEIEVKEPLSIISFNAVADACVEQQVGLTLDFKPCTIAGCAPGTSCTCTQTVDWYKDGNLIGSTPNLNQPLATFTYFGPPSLAGNYYAVLKDDCCPGDSLLSQLIKFAPSCVPIIKGPCFRCNNELVTLTGGMVLPPRDPCPDVCTFQWCEVINGVPAPIPGATNSTYVTNHAGTFILKSDCNGCVKWSDPFVLPQCNNNCSCGSLQWATFFQKWGPNKPITCNNAASPVLAPCPKQGRDYVIHGKFFCAQSSCGSNTVTWELTRPSPLPPITGATTVTYPYFYANLPWNLSTHPGIYTLKITRQCGIVPCSCSFTFEVPNCGCNCSDLMGDANQGFHIGGNGLNCIRSFKPYALDVCDTVTWTVNSTPLPVMSIGNNAFNYNFSNNGTYVVCMNVTRQPLSGPSCSFVKCRTITISCSGDPYGFCPVNTLRNGNFTEGLIPGHLSAQGELADWMQLQDLTEGLVFVEDSSGGYDDGYLVLAGGLNNPAAIYQSVDLAQEPFTIIEYNRRNFSGEQLPPGTKLEFRLYADSSVNAENQLVYVDSIEGSVDTGWIAQSASVQIDLNPDYPYLVVSLANDDPMEIQSIIGLDNLEVCTSLISDAGEPLRNQVIFRLFPNPATNEITIEWSGFDGKNCSVQIVGKLGQLLRRLPVPDGSNRLTTNVTGLPGGIYFVRILSAGRPLKVLKFVKF